MTHQLKTYPKYFDALARGEKNFEVRRNDRNYQVGDVLTLQRYCPKADAYTGAEIDKRVTYVLPGNDFGIAKDYCVLALEDVKI